LSIEFAIAQISKTFCNLMLNLSAGYGWYEMLHKSQMIMFV